MKARLLVDGTGVVHRTWWASPANCPERFRDAVKRAMPAPSAEIVVCWDGPGSWRRELWEGYKAQRTAKPEALTRTLLECRAAFPGYVALGFEADDLLATFATPEACAEYTVTLILSDDKDLLQLVKSRCLVVNSLGQVFGAERVTNKFGVPPDRIRHLLSWTGDKVDGLPGVPGYGPKKAIPKALAGEIGVELTFDLAELAIVPKKLVMKV